MKPIEIPTPKFQFGQVVLIKMNHTTVTHVPCEYCTKGQIHVGDLKPLTCPKCNGSGHGFEIKERTTTTTIDGMLEIMTYRIEISDPPRDRTWGRGFEGVSYAGKVVWRDDLSEIDRRSNVFWEDMLLEVETQP